MSLINNMLKDLEKRKSEHYVAPPVILTAIPSRDKRFNFYVPFNKRHLGIAICLLIVLAWLTSMFLHRRIHSVTPMLESPVSQKTVSDNNNSAWLKPAVIKGITLQVKDNITELTFLLDHPALYHLGSNEMKNELTLVIEDSHLDSELPPTTYLSSGIQHLDVQQTSQDTRFNFVLSSDSTIKYINLSSEDKNPELVIAIQNPRAKPGAAAQAAPIKTQAIQSLLAERYQLALSLAENGKYENAIQDLTALLKVDPEHKDARVSLAALLIDQGNGLKAKKIINAGIELNPSHLPFVELKARILTNEGKTGEALALLQSVSPPINENPEYHAFIAALYERTNNNTLAVTLYQKLISMNNHNGNWWFGLAVSLDKLGQQRSASDAYSRALTEGHLSPESIVYLQSRLKVLQETPNEKG